MAEISIAAETRTEFGKGAARRIRRDDKVPAVLYGRGSDPVHVTLPGHALMLALKDSNALLSIELDGDNHLTIPKQVQRDPLKGFIEHADLLIVKKGEKVTVDISVTLTGEADPTALVVLENATISVDVDPTTIPEGFEISVEGLEVGAQILAGDITLPAGVDLAVEPDLLVVNVTHAPTAAEVEAELEEAEADAGIERDESDEELAEAAEGESDEAADGEGDSAEPESE